jgi:hypothetical protein
VSYDAFIAPWSTPNTPGRIKSSEIVSLLKAPLGREVKRGNCTVLPSGEIVEITRVFEMIAGFPTERPSVLISDPISRFTYGTSRDMHMFTPPTKERLAAFTNAAILIDPTELAKDDLHVRRMAALSLSGFCDM